MRAWSDLVKGHLGAEAGVEELESSCSRSLEVLCSPSTHPLVHSSRWARRTGVRQVRSAEGGVGVEWGGGGSISRTHVMWTCQSLRRFQHTGEHAIMIS